MHRWIPWSTMNCCFSDKYVGNKEKMCWTLPLWLFIVSLHEQLWINMEYVEYIPVAWHWVMATNCPLCWSNTKGWPGGCHDYAEQLHWPFVFNCAWSLCGCCCGNGLYARKIFLRFIFLVVQLSRQNTKKYWQGVNFPGVIRKQGISFPEVMWNSYTASSKRTLFELWHK